MLIFLLLFEMSFFSLVTRDKSYISLWHEQFEFTAKEKQKTNIELYAIEEKQKGMKIRS